LDKTLDVQKGSSDIQKIVFVPTDAKASGYENRKPAQAG